MVVYVTGGRFEMFYEISERGARQKKRETTVEPHDRFNRPLIGLDSMTRYLPSRSNNNSALPLPKKKRNRMKIMFLS